MNEIQASGDGHRDLSHRPRARQSERLTPYLFVLAPFTLATEPDEAGDQ